MQASNSFKREFLQKLLSGLQQSNLQSNTMSLSERKAAIKLSSDVALASARRGAKWSQSLFTKLTKQPLHQKPAASLRCKKSKKILKRSCNMRRVRKSAPRRILATTLAKRMQKKRTLVLKSLIPGGESMDELSLLEETVDYIISLRAQIDVMRRLSTAFDQQRN